jgi:uncharacterized membrane protein YeiH
VVSSNKEENMQYLLEHFGVAVAAITGVLAAKGKHIDLFGVVVLALVTSFGGGTVRDLTLGCLPVFWIQDPNYLLNAFLVAVVTFAVARFRPFPETALLVADAFALSFFTILGTQKSLGLGAPNTIAVAMGVITGVAGGIMRDVLLGEIPLVFRPHIHLYATAAFLGSSLFVVMRLGWPDDYANLVAGTLATLLFRLIGIRWKLTLPVFEENR